MSDADLLGDFYDEFERRAEQRRAERRARRGNRPRARRAPVRPTSGGGWLDRRLLTVLTVALAVATAAGLAVLWPSGAIPHLRDAPPAGHGAHVVGVRDAACEGPAGGRCTWATVSVDHHRARVDLGPAPTAPRLTVGEAIRVGRATVPATRTTPARTSWTFVDIDRHGSLLWLALIAIALSALVLRWRGLLAALGVAISLWLVMTFLIPALLAGEPALAVALVTALAVMFVTLVLTSGVGPQTLAAALGIGSTLLLTALIALVAVSVAHLDGRTDDLSTYLSTIGPGISLQGIVLAGMVIGALGVLADTAVTQASAVMSLRHSDPDLGARGLYRASLRIGRDHLSATIHTLVLAYAGAALPLLLVTRYSGLGPVDAVNTQDIAEPIVAALVGCLGLICAVPLTTGLAAVLVARAPAAEFAGVHAHEH
jgi:uncharacterized membrane protein